MQHRGQIDLVICDVVMPRLGGDEMYARMREMDGSIRILFTSGYSSADLVGGRLLDPAYPHLPKPWTVDELLDRVRHSLHSG